MVADLEHRSVYRWLCGHPSLLVPGSQVAGTWTPPRTRHYMPLSRLGPVAGLQHYESPLPDTKKANTTSAWNIWCWPTERLVGCHAQRPPSTLSATLDGTPPTGDRAASAKPIGLMVQVSNFALSYESLL
jgi:hypothetical protein